jgi:hypothetical protein
MGFTEWRHYWMRFQAGVLGSGVAEQGRVEAEKMTQRLNNGMEGVRSNGEPPVPEE